MDNREAHSSFVNVTLHKIFPIYFFSTKVINFSVISGLTRYDAICDLLQKICIFDIVNSEQENKGTREQRNKRTKEQENKGTREQRNKRTKEQEKGCDLLQKICIFDIVNS
jgi:hypothetical protein